jgi:hypothetical protein
VTEAQAQADAAVAVYGSVEAWPVCQLEPERFARCGNCGHLRDVHEWLGSWRGGLDGGYADVCTGFLAAPGVDDRGCVILED